jgi:hypothetical protein
MSRASTDLERVGDAMDDLASQAEEWGAMQMSAPLLVEAGTNFNFDLHRGATNYFSEAKSEIQSATASFDQRSQTFTGSGQVQNTTGGATTPPSTSGNGSSSNTPSNPAAVFNSQTLTPFLGLMSALNSPNPTLKNRVALNIAAGDQTTEEIFRLLSQPEQAARFAGKQVVFGVVMVSVDPGYRTRHDYAADLGILPEFKYADARLEAVERVAQDTTNLPKTLRAAVLFSYGLTNAETVANLHCTDVKALLDDLATKDGAQRQAELQQWNQDIPEELNDANFDPNNPTTFPVAMAVSPLADINVQDQASSTRSQSQFALSLAGVLQQSGLSAQASVFEGYAHRLEQDARSRVASDTVNTYSAGGLFGWQVGPSPNVGGKGGDVLNRQTFPSLVMVAFDNGMLYPHFRTGGDRPVTVLEPEIEFISIPRWMPLKHSWWWFSNPKRLSESDRMETSAKLADAAVIINNLQTNSTYARAASLANYRLRALKYQFFGNVGIQAFDPVQEVPLP